MDYIAPTSIIGGRKVAGSETRVAVLNPCDGAVLAELPYVGPDEIDTALLSSQKGLQVWRALSAERRAEILLTGCQILRSRADAIGRLITLENGKPLAEATAEVLRAAAFIEWDANEGRRAYGQVLPAQPGLHRYVLCEPAGVVAAFSPWNAPISSPARKIGAALGAGCAVIIKASEETPAAAIKLVECLHEGGVPPDALNLVFGDPAAISRHLIASPVVRAVTFTGAIEVGKQLAALAGAHMKPVVMELGGHSPVIVCADADPVKVAKQGARAKFRNAGQVCTSPTRFIVHESIRAEFIDAFVAETQAIRIGNGLGADVDMGPLANMRRLTAISSLVEDAVTKGARVLTGGKALGNAGYFYAPTVLVDVPADANVSNVEPFGPIAVLSSFSGLDDAIAEANRLPYGLAAFGFTNDAAKAHQLASTVECGILAINSFRTSSEETPFGGVKDSGYGREGGQLSLETFIVRRMVSHTMNM